MSAGNECPNRDRGLKENLKLNEAGTKRPEGEGGLGREGNYGVQLFLGVSVTDDNKFGDLKQETFISHGSGDPHTLLRLSRKNGPLLLLLLVTVRISRHVATSVCFLTVSSHSFVSIVYIDTVTDFRTYDVFQSILLKTCNHKLVIFPDPDCK